MESLRKKLGIPALIEIAGSLLLLLCLFLPWFQFSLNGSCESFFFWGRTGFFAWTDKYLCDYWLGHTNFGYILYFFPIMCIVNMVTQYFVRLPWLSFYTGVVSAFVALLAFHYYTEDMLYYMRIHVRLGDMSDANIGVGVILTAIISILMMISAWTNLGWHYKRHRIYIIIVLVYCTVGCAGIYFNWGSSEVFCLFLVGGIHAPFLIYALLVALCSRFVNYRKTN